MNKEACDKTDGVDIENSFANLRHDQQGKHWLDFVEFGLFWLKSEKIRAEYPSPVHVKLLRKKRDVEYHDDTDWNAEPDPNGRRTFSFNW